MEILVVQFMRKPSLNKDLCIATQVLRYGQIETYHLYIDWNYNFVQYYFINTYNNSLILPLVISLYNPVYFIGRKPSACPGMLKIKSTCNTINI